VLTVRLHASRTLSWAASVYVRSFMSAVSCAPFCVISDGSDIHIAADVQLLCPEMCHARWSLAMVDSFLKHSILEFFAIQSSSAFAARLQSVSNPGLPDWQFSIRYRKGRFGKSLGADPSCFGSSSPLCKQQTCSAFTVMCRMQYVWRLDLNVYAKCKVVVV